MEITSQPYLMMYPAKKKSYIMADLNGKIKHIKGCGSMQKLSLFMRDEIESFFKQAILL